MLFQSAVYINAASQKFESGLGMPKTIGLRASCLPQEVWNEKPPQAGESQRTAGGAAPKQSVPRPAPRPWQRRKSSHLSPLSRPPKPPTLVPLGRRMKLAPSKNTEFDSITVPEMSARTTLLSDAGLK